MRFAGNVIWFVLGGAVTGLLWLLGAAVFAVTIIGLPLTRAAIEMAKMSAFPFGKEVVHVRELDRKGLTAGTAFSGTIGFIFNVIWALTFGLALFVSYLVAGVFCCLTIIGIPFGLQSFKLAGLSLWPVGRRVVPIELAHAARTRNAAEKLDNHRQGRGYQDQRYRSATPAPVRRAPIDSRKWSKADREKYAAQNRIEPEQGDPAAPT